LRVPTDACFIAVLASIDFDDEARTVTAKVRDVPANWRLAAKMESFRFQLT
jgi:hypothetical protein